MQDMGRPWIAQLAGFDGYVDLSAASCAWSRQPRRSVVRSHQIETARIKVASSIDSMQLARKQLDRFLSRSSAPTFTARSASTTTEAEPLLYGPDGTVVVYKNPAALLWAFQFPESCFGSTSYDDLRVFFLDSFEDTVAWLGSNPAWHALAAETRQSIKAVLVSLKSRLKHLSRLATGIVTLSELQSSALDFVQSQSAWFSLHGSHPPPYLRLTLVGVMAVVGAAHL